MASVERATIVRHSAAAIVMLAATGALGAVHCSKPSRPIDPPPSDVAAGTPDAAASAVDSTPAWPKVVVVPDPVPDASMLDTGDSVELVDSAHFDAAMTDATSDTGDARTLRSDALDNAPLLGTKTFVEETPVRGIRRITSTAARVHKAPKDASIIATLPKGTEIFLVAEYAEWYRVRFVDPSSQQPRQGWIYIINFVGPRMKTCPVGWTHHEQDGGWCDRDCNRNADCKALKGYKCSGTSCFYAAD